MPFVPTDAPDDLVPRGILEGTGTRAFLHNFAANPDVAKRYMASLGNDIRSYGKPGSWDWAWKPKGDENAPWTPADAHTFGGWILNHVADAVNAVVTGLAATGAAGLTAETGPGAIAAGSAAGAATSGGIESARQGIGSALGIPNNLDTGEIAAATIGGGLAEPTGSAIGGAVRSIGRLAGGTLRMAGRLAPDVAAKIADINPLGASGSVGTRAGEVLMEGSRLTQGGRIPLIDPERAGGLIRGAIRFVQRVGIPEVKAADAKVAAQAENGLTIDLSRAMKTLQDRTLGDVGKTAAIQVERASAPTLKSDVANLMERLTSETGFSGDWGKTPADVAVSFRRALQNEAAGKGAYAGSGPSKIYGQVVKTAAAQTRSAIESAMEQVDPTFPALMKSAYDKMTILDDFKAALKMSSMGASGKKAATSYVRGVYGESNIAYLRMLNDLDKHFSTGLRGKLVDRAIEAIRQANIGGAIGGRGVPEMVPRITSGGHVRSAAAVVGLGYLTGGPLGALAGGVASSPRFIMRAAQPLARAGAVAQNATSALARAHLGGASRVIATGVLSAGDVAAMREVIRAEGGGSKGIARQEEGKPVRRQIVIGR